MKIMLCYKNYGKNMLKATNVIVNMVLLVEFVTKNLHVLRLVLTMVDVTLSLKNTSVNAKRVSGVLVVIFLHVQITVILMVFVLKLIIIILQNQHVSVNSVSMARIAVYKTIPIHTWRATLLV